MMVAVAREEAGSVEEARAAAGWAAAAGWEGVAGAEVVGLPGRGNKGGGDQ